MDILTEYERYEPANIKAALPVEWALGHLFGVWGAGNGEMISCPLPGHQDDTASFNLWASNEDGVPQRFGCFGCGANGDVIDLIREARGVGFTEACTIAVDELLPEFINGGEWEPTRTSDPRRAATPAELEKEFNGLRFDGEPLWMFLVAKGLTDVAAYAQEVWGWHGITRPLPAIVHPHLNWDKELTGIRYRSVRSGSRWTARGSRFDALYGAWRDWERPAVLLTEGETDTVYAAWQLQGEQVDVLGLPSGAAQRPPEECVKRLEMRTVWLAFDGDMAGRIAEARWKVALEGTSDVRIIRMPEGQDVCSVGVHVRKLMESAS